MTKRLSRSGFTLIELLIVIAIMAVITTLLMANFSGARERSRDIKRKADLAALKNALQLYYTDYGHYPDDGGDLKIHGCGNLGTSTCNWTSGSVAGSVFSAGIAPNVSTYLGVIPGDPINTGAIGSQQYAYCTNPVTMPQGSDCTKVDFILYTTLENKSDPDIAKSQSRCGVSQSTITNSPNNIYMVCNQ